MVWVGSLETNPLEPLPFPTMITCTSESDSALAYSLDRLKWHFLSTCAKMLHHIHYSNQYSLLLWCNIWNLPACSFWATAGPVSVREEDAHLYTFTHRCVTLHSLAHLCQCLLRKLKVRNPILRVQRQGTHVDPPWMERMRLGKSLRDWTLITSAPENFKAFFFLSGWWIWRPNDPFFLRSQ